METYTQYLNTIYNQKYLKLTINTNNFSRFYQISIIVHYKNIFISY